MSGFMNLQASTKESRAAFRKSMEREESFRQSVLASPPLSFTAAATANAVAQSNSGNPHPNAPSRPPLAPRPSTALSRARNATARASQNAEESLRSLLFLGEEFLHTYEKHPKHLQPTINMYQYLAPTPERVRAALDPPPMPVGADPASYKPRSKHLLSRLRMLIPDTVVNTNAGTLFLYTDAEGYICQTPHFTSKSIIARMTHDAPVVPPTPAALAAMAAAAAAGEPDFPLPSSSPTNTSGGAGANSNGPQPPSPAQIAADTFIAAVVKTPGSGPVNDVTLLTCKDVRALVESKLEDGSSAAGVFAIQKFIRPHGSHACLYRTVWSPSNEAILGKGFTYILTNQHKVDDVDKEPSNAARLLVSPVSASGGGGMNRNITIVRQAGKACEDLMRSNGQIAMHLSRTLNVTFRMLVCDYIKDSFGRTVLLQVKAFLLTEPSISRPLSARTSSNNNTRPAAAMRVGGKSARCACCKRFLDVSQLQFQMTASMLAEFKRHLETHGRSERANFLLNMMTRGHTFGAETDNEGGAGGAGKLGSSIDPGPFGVCITCYEVFQAIQNLRLVARQFAELTGVPQKKRDARKAGSMEEGLEAEDGYRIRSSVDSSTSSAANGGGPSRSRANTAKSILTHSSVIPTTKSTLMTNPVEHIKKSASSATSPTALSVNPNNDEKQPTPSSMIEPEFLLQGTSVSGGSLAVKLEHVEVAPETMAPPNLLVCRFFTYLDHVSNIPSIVPPLHSNVFQVDGECDEVLGGSIQFNIFERDTKVDFNAGKTSRVNVKDVMPADSQSDAAPPSQYSTPFQPAPMSPFHGNNNYGGTSDAQQENIITNVIYINRLAIFYFFATKDTFQKFLERNLTVNLFLRCRPQNNPHAPVILRPAGKVELNLRQFANPLVYTYAYRKVFAGNATGDLSSLKMTVGAVMGESIDTSLVNLRPYTSGVFIPDNHSFYTCDPLPAEWIQALPDVNERNRRLESKRNVARREHADPLFDILGPGSSASTDEATAAGSANTSPSKVARSIASTPATVIMTPSPATATGGLLSSTTTRNSSSSSSRHHLIVQVHAVYCLRARHPLVCEFQLFGQQHQLPQKQSYRLQQSSAAGFASLAPTSPPPTGSGANAGGSSGVASSSANAVSHSRVVIFDSNESIAIPKDFEDQLPTFIALTIRELVPTDGSGVGGSAPTIRRKATRLRGSNPNVATNDLSSTGGGGGGGSSAAGGFTRGSWSVTVNMSEIKSQGTATDALGSPSSSGSQSANYNESSGTTQGAVEGTFDLIPSHPDEMSEREAPYISLCIRYQ